MHPTAASHLLVPNGACKRSRRAQPHPLCVSCVAHNLGQETCGSLWINAALRHAHPSQLRGTPGHTCHGHLLNKSTVQQQAPDLQVQRKTVKAYHVHATASPLKLNVKSCKRHPLHILCPAFPRDAADAALLQSRREHVETQHPHTLLLTESIRPYTPAQSLEPWLSRRSQEVTGMSTHMCLCNQTASFNCLCSHTKHIQPIASSSGIKAHGTYTSDLTTSDNHKLGKVL